MFNFTDSLPLAVAYAGYCISLQQDTAMQTLLEKACQRLECPRQCSSGCSACLCDYPNQRAWDMFDRRPVLEWLQGFVQPAFRTPQVNGIIFPHPYN